MAATKSQKYEDWITTCSHPVLSCLIVIESKLISLHRVVTVIEAPGGTSLSSGTEDLGYFIGKVVTVVHQETVASEVTSIVPGTPLDAVDI